MQKQIGTISDKDLRNVFPELYESYQDILSSKHPDIEIYTTDQYSPGLANKGEKKIVVLYKDGQTKTLSGSWGGSNMFSKTIDDVDSVKLVPDSAVLELTVGSHTFVYLYVHPSFVNPTLTSDEDDELDVLQKAVLYSLRALKSSFRVDELRRLIQNSYPDSKRILSSEEIASAKDVYKSNYSSAKDYQELFVEVALSLQDLGYAKISSNGATQITIDGKNKLTTLENNI
jgi:hypothetical protein